MSLPIIDIFVKCIIDIALFLEFSNEDCSSNDNTILMFEGLSYNLSLLHNCDKEHLKAKIIELSNEYPPDKIEFVKCLPDNIGI